MKFLRSGILWVSVVLVAACCATAPITAAENDGKELIGAWKLTGWTLQVVGENGSREPFGPNPKGRLILTSQGHWIVIITGADRQPAKTTDDKVKLLDSVIAYSGKYKIEGNKVTTKVDMSSNEIFSGANQDQVRFFEVHGDKLVIRTPEISSSALPGKRTVATLTWERE